MFRRLGLGWLYLYAYELLSYYLLAMSALTNADNIYYFYSTFAFQSTMLW